MNAAIGRPTKMQVYASRQGIGTLRLEKVRWQATQAKAVARQGEPLTVGQFAQRWMRDTFASLAKSTRVHYELDVRRRIVPALGDIPLTELRHGHLADFTAQLATGLAPSTVRTTLAVLGTLLGHAVAEGEITANPCRGTWRRLTRRLPPADPPAEKALLPETVTALLAKCREQCPDLYPLLMVYAFTGCRRNEGLGLQESDLDFAAGTIRIERQWHGRSDGVGIPKGRRGRTIDMAQALEAPLRDAIKRSRWIANALDMPSESPRWVFRSPYTGLPYNPAYPNHVMRALRGTETTATPKGFRHHAATVLMHAGESPRFVQLTLGHRDLATTMRYVSERRMSRRAALDVLGGAS